MFNIDVRANVREVTRGFDKFIREQIPFATAQALNGVVKKVKDAERVNMSVVLDMPTPFTVNAIGLRLANKRNLTAMLFLKDKTAAYLEPYEFGGLNKLNSKALLVPMAQKVNQYGNLPRNTVKRLLARPNVFAGKVRFKKSGQVIDGIWERPKHGDRQRGGRGSKGNTQRKVGNARTGLKLLIKFDDAHEAKQRLNWRAVASRTAGVAFSSEFKAAMKKAIETASK